MSRADTAQRVGGNMAYGYETLEAAEAEARKEGYIKTAYELGRFRTGYEKGRVEQFIYSITNLCRYMNRGEVMNLSAKLETLYEQTKIEMWGDQS